MKRMGEQEQIMLVDGKQHIIKYVDDYGHWEDLGALNDEGQLPCPFCGKYPESFTKGNEYTKKRGSVLKCNKCHYELTVCAIYQTIEWCKEKVLYNWNRRV